MRTALKISIAVVSAMFMLLLMTYIAAVYVVDDRFYINIVREAVRDSTGHDLEIRGQFELERSLRPGLVAEDVRLFNPGMRPSAELARVERLRFHLELLPLLSGVLRFAVTMKQPHVHLQVDAEGRRNWQVSKISESPRSESDTDSGWDLVIDHIEMFDGQLIFEDSRDDSSREVMIKNFALHHDREAGIASLGFFGSYQDTDYAINGTVRDTAGSEPLRTEWIIDAHGPGTRADRDPPPTVHLSASGTISRPDQDPAFDLAVDGRIQNVLPVVEVLGVGAGEWAQLGPVSARARLQLAAGAYQLTDLDAKWATDGLTLTARGAVSDLGGAFQSDLHLQVAADTLKQLLQVPALGKLPFPDVGPVMANGRLRGGRGSYRIDDLQAQLKTEGSDFKAAGAITDLDGQPQTSLEVNAHIRDLSRIPSMLGSETNLPAVGPIQVTGVVIGGQGQYQVERFDAKWEQPGVRANVTGNAENLLQSPTVAMQIALQTDSLDTLSVLAQRNLPAMGPVSLQSKLALDADQLRASDFTLQIGSSDVSGQISVNREPGPVRLSARLSSRVLDLDQLLAAPMQSDQEPEQTQDGPAQPQAGSTDAVEGAEPERGDRPWLPIEPLNLSWMDLWQGLVDVRVDTMIQDGDAFKDVVVQVQLEPGILYIPISRMKLNEGELSLIVEIDANQSPPTFRYRNEAKEIDIGSVLNLPEGVIIGGKTTGTVDLYSSGSSPAEIMSNLNGQVLLKMGEARIVEDRLAGVSSALLGGMLSGVAKTEDGQAYTDYQCGVFGFKVKDGIVTMRRSIALQSKRFNVGGSGQVDLNKGTIHLELRPRARKGLGMSAAMLTGGFKISGKLDVAEAGLSMKGLLESYLLSSTAALLAAEPTGAVATSAVLALRGIWDRVTAGTFSCNNTLKRIESDGLVEE